MPKKPTLAETLWVKSSEKKLNKVTVLNSDVLAQILPTLPSDCQIKCSVEARKTESYKVNKAVHANDNFEVDVENYKRRKLRKLNKDFQTPIELMEDLIDAQEFVGSDARVRMVTVKVANGDEYRFDKMEQNKALSNRIVPEMQGRSPLVLRRFNGEASDVFTYRVGNKCIKELENAVFGLIKSKIGIGQSPKLQLT